MNLIVLRPAIIRQTRFFNLGEAISLREVKLWNQNPLKIDLVSNPEFAEVLITAYIHLPRKKLTLKVAIYIFLLEN